MMQEYDTIPEATGYLYVVATGPHYEHEVRGAYNSFEQARSALPDNKNVTIYRIELNSLNVMNWVDELQGWYV